MDKSKAEDAALEFLKSQGIDPEAMSKEQAESKENIKRLRHRIQVIRGRVRDRRNLTIGRQA